MKTGTIVIIALVAFGMAYQVINRLSADALNVGFGVLCGMAASIPVALGLLVALMRRRDAGREVELADPPPQPHVAAPGARFAQPSAHAFPPGHGPLQQPQIIVIAPPQGQYGQAPLYGFNPAYGAPAPGGDEAIDARDWKIIGEE
jgi:hypothetical protein